MIGLARERNGLYHFESFGQNNTRSNFPFSFLFRLPFSNKNKIWLYDFHLGHLSFNVLKIIDLFKGINMRIFHCDVCELAKDKHTSFPISNKKMSSPFTLSIMMFGDLLWF